VHLRNLPRLQLVCRESVLTAFCVTSMQKNIGQCWTGDKSWRPTWSLVLHTAAFTKVNKTTCCYLFRDRVMPQTVSRRPLPVDLLPRRHWFDPGPAHARFVLNKVAVRQVSLQVLPFFHVNIISPTLQTHSIICYRRYINSAINIIVKQHNSKIYSQCKNRKTHA
jgi:hypothetical protein